MPHDPRRRAAVWLAIAAVAVFLTVVLLRAFVGDLYRVDTGSMRPTIQAGDGRSEWVLVLHGAPDPLRRFDLVVVRDPETGDALVKRVGGLGGESVEIVDGDMLVDGQRLAPDVPRPPPVPIFDSEHHVMGDYFFFRSTPPGAWTLAGRGAHLDALDVSPGSESGMMFFQKPLFDDRLDPDGARVPGTLHVNDAMLWVDVELLAIRDGGAFRLRLVESGDTFEADFERGESDAQGNGLAVTRLLRRPGADGGADDELARAELRWRVGERIELRFANVDNHLSLWARRGSTWAPVAAASYGENRPYRGMTATDGRAIGPRVGFGASGGDLVVHRVRLFRDVAWFHQGSFGVDRPLFLGPHELFVLGDDSAHSRDSRHFGPLERDAVLGRPIAILWPWAHIRTFASPLPW